MLETKCSLEQARNWYWGWVPWEIDEKDLKIINRTRKEFRGTPEFSAILTQRLWYAAQR